MCELVAQRRHHVDHQRTHGIETRDARRVHAQKWRSQVAWLVSEANAYTDLTASLFVLYPDMRTSTARRRVDDWHLVGVPPNIQYIAVTSDVVSLKGVPQ